MSHTATNYLKDLPEMPLGASIKGTQWAVLRLLALSHNEKAGCAWLSMKEIARQCNISVRYARTVVGSLERIGIIKRVYTRSLKGGGQSSNCYTFPALGQSSAKLFENLNQVAWVPRAPMSVSLRGRGPRGTDNCIRDGRAPVTVSPGDTAPPIESLGETLRESLRESLVDHSERANHRTAVGNARAMSKQEQDSPYKTEDQCCNLDLAQTAINAAVSDLRQSLFPELSLDGYSPFVSGAKDWKSSRLQKLSVVALERRDSGGLLMTVKSPNPKSATRGLKLHQTRLEESLGKFYGVSVALRLKTGG